MKKILLPTAILALLIAFMEYDTHSFLNFTHSGLGNLLITTAVVVYFCVVMKVLDKKIKRTNIMYLIALELLGIANFLSSDVNMATLNKFAIIVMIVNLVINAFRDDSSWGIKDHVSAWFRAVLGGISFLNAAPKDIASLRAKEDSEPSVVKSNIIKVLIGIGISIPLLIVILVLLCSADAIFADLFRRLIPEFKFGKLLSFIFIAVLAFLYIYAIIQFVLNEKFEKEKNVPRRHSAIIAITVGVLVSLVYGMFSMVQFVYLFGHHVLPLGYTYATYAKEGVFQLMWLSVLNLIIVLCGIVMFEKNKVLRILLTFISACTYLMIASSSYRLWQYVNIYHALTRKRIWGIWGLVTVAICFVGVLIYIYKDDFRLYRFGLTTIMATYLLLAFLKPDYIVAKVNVEILPPVMQAQCDTELLESLCLDALPVLDKHYPDWIHSSSYKYLENSFSWKNINVSYLQGRNARNQ